MVLAKENPRKLKINQPVDYEDMLLFEKLILNAWIVNHIEPYKIKSFNGPTSYRLKHQFEYSKDGFYITNGQMKGALLAAGFRPKDENDLNWTFALSKKLQDVDFAKLPGW
ncbi:hypothetical protein [Planococcus beigongshangi]|uniref:hypothetical protein n=1 Tax=Planococcus beigongshangi TaxID=2782536 RepID=UPI00193C6A60|nr:hypothetical protein [Planococcus beigongshangi]